MSLRSPLTRRAALGGLAVAGLIAGHCFASRFFGDAGVHAHHHGTHSHLPYVLAVIVLGTAVFGLLVYFVMRQVRASAGLKVEYAFREIPPE